MVDQDTLLEAFKDFVVKLWMRKGSKKNICQIIQSFLPGYKVLDITILNGEISPHTWKRMLSDGSIVTEIQKTFHMDIRAVIEVIHRSDPKPFLIPLNLESQSRDRIDLMMRQMLYTATLMSNSCQKGDNYMDIIGKLRALSITFCVQDMQYFADPQVCDDPGRVIHHIEGSYYRENLAVSTNTSLSIFVELNKLLRKPENDRIILGSPLLGAFSETLGGLHKMNRAQVERVMAIGGEPVVEFAGIVADISDNQYVKDKYQMLLSKEALREADARDAESKGIEKGIEKGMKKAAMVFSLHSQNHSVKTIAQKTNLSMQEVQQLLKALETA